jgi:hypothetical protein
MKMFERIIHTYDWESKVDFLQSLVPSAKYHATFLSVGISGAIALLQSYIDFSLIAAFGFALLAFVELCTGIYASVCIKKEKLKSLKMGRFVIKLSLMLLCLFILGLFAKEFGKSNVLLGELFSWMRDGVFAFTAIEYLVSVLENVAVISGQSNSRLLNAIKNKMDKVFGSDPQ